MDFDVIIIWYDHVVVISLSLVSHENVDVTVLSFFVSLYLLDCSVLEYSLVIPVICFVSLVLLVFVCSSI